MPRKRIRDKLLDDILSNKKLATQQVIIYSSPISAFATNEQPLVKERTFAKFQNDISTSKEGLRSDVTEHFILSQSQMVYSFEISL